MPDGDRRMLIAGCDADASYPAYSVLSGLHVPPFCLTGDPQRGPGVWPMPVIAGGFCGVTHQAKTLTVKAPARLNATIA